MIFNEFKTCKIGFWGFRSRLLIHIKGNTMALQITDATLDKVLQTDKPVLLDFWAEWCGPCKMIAPIIEEIGEEYKDRVVVGKINVDDNDNATSKYGIRNIPTVLFIKNGKVMEKMVGAASKKMFIEKIERLL